MNSVQSATSNRNSLPRIRIQGTGVAGKWTLFSGTTDSDKVYIISQSDVVRTAVIPSPATISITPQKFDKIYNLSLVSSKNVDGLYASVNQKDGSTSIYPFSTKEGKADLVLVDAEDGDGAYVMFANAEQLSPLAMATQKGNVPESTGIIRPVSAYISFVLNPLKPSSTDKPAANVSNASPANSALLGAILGGGAILGLSNLLGNTEEGNALTAYAANSGSLGAGRSGSGGGGSTTSTSGNSGGGGRGGGSLTGISITWPAQGLNKSSGGQGSPPVAIGGAPSQAKASKPTEAKDPTASATPTLPPEVCGKSCPCDKPVDKCSTCGNPVLLWKCGCSNCPERPSRGKLTVRVNFPKPVPNALIQPSFKTTTSGGVDCLSVAVAQDWHVTAISDEAIEIQKTYSIYFDPPDDGHSDKITITLGLENAVSWNEKVPNPVTGGWVDVWRRKWDNYKWEFSIFATARSCSSENHKCKPPDPNPNPNRDWRIPAQVKSQSHITINPVPGVTTVIVPKELKPIDKPSTTGGSSRNPGATPNSGVRAPRIETTPNSSGVPEVGQDGRVDGNNIIIPLDGSTFCGEKDLPVQKDIIWNVINEQKPPSIRKIKVKGEPAANFNDVIAYFPGGKFRTISQNSSELILPMDWLATVRKTAGLEDVTRFIITNGSRWEFTSNKNGENVAILKYPDPDSKEFEFLVRSQVADDKLTEILLQGRSSANLTNKQKEDLLHAKRSIRQNLIWRKLNHASDEQLMDFYIQSAIEQGMGAKEAKRRAKGLIAAINDAEKSFDSIAPELIDKLRKNPDEQIRYGIFTGPIIESQKRPDSGGQEK